MADFTNTRTTLGDQGALDAVIAHTPTTFNDNEVKTLGQYAFYKHTQLTSVSFPILTSLGNNAFQDCSALTTVDIGGRCTISSAFSGCSSMDALILRDTSGLCTLNGNLAGTKIAKDQGGIYVPSTLLSQYKAANGWKAYAHLIFPLTDYPRQTFATITDTWTQIIAASGDGTYSSKYSVGDTAMLTINNTAYMVQLVAMDADDKADNSGKAHMTWLMRGLYATNHRMNASMVAWPETEMRSWLISDVLTAFPAELQTAIVEVKKTYGYYDGTTLMEGTSNEKIWVPSTREVCLTGSSLKETNGAQYSTIFTDNSSRIKNTTSGSAGSWWLRSAYSSSSFVYVSSYGGGGDIGPNNIYGVAAGFCI